MIPTIAITIILIILAAIIFFSVFKSAIKATLSLIFLIFVALIVVGFMFVQDANNFKETFFEEPSTYVLEHEDVLITAFSMTALNISTFKPLSVDIASDMVLDEGPGKVFIINKEVLTASVDESLFKLTGFGFEDALASNRNDIRASAFIVSYLATQKEEGNLYFIKQVRNDNMAILPRSFAIKVITFDAKGYLEKIKTIISNQKSNVVHIVNETKTVLNDTL